MVNYRNILEPVGAITIRVTVTRPTRYPRPLDYVKTGHRFIVELVFNGDIDLAVFERAVDGSPIRLFEYRSSTPGGMTRLFVTDDRLPRSCEETEMWRWIDLELPRVNCAVALKCPSYHAAEFKALIELFPDGRSAPQTRWKRIKVHALEWDPEIDRALSFEGMQLSRYLDKSEADPNFTEAMMFVGRSLTFEDAQPWADLYRAYEIIAHHAGGQHRLVTGSQWGAESEHRLFRQTVNHQKAIGVFSRHARTQTDPPKDPMSFESARRFMLRLMDAWLLSPISAVPVNSPSSTEPPPAEQPPTQNELLPL